MISRIRIDAIGKTPNEVADTLYPHADEIERLLGRSVSRGECVIEADLKAPDDSDYAFKGRLNLHVDISPEFRGNTSAVGAASGGQATVYFDPTKMVST